MKTIYLHRNKINNKVYIGQTTQQSLQQRWKNGKGYKNCTLFYKAIQKYGWNSFEHIILEQNEDWTQEELNEKEREYILLFNSNNLKYGYNITEGGSNTISPKANVRAVEWMQQHPEFGLARAADMHKWQKEHPQEMLEKRRANATKATNARKRKVICVETDEIFESATDAARKTPKTTQSKICMVCKGKRKTCGGYRWRYLEEEDI